MPETDIRSAKSDSVFDATGAAGFVYVIICTGNVGERSQPDEGCPAAG